MPSYVDRNQGQPVQSLDFKFTSQTPPPPYGTQDTNTERGPARREWDNVAARIAARTAAGRRISRRSSRGEASNRIQKAAGRKHNPGLSIDTSVTRHNAPAPQQLQPKGLRKRASSGYKKLDEGTQLRSIASQIAQPQTNLPAYNPSDFGLGLVSHFSPETPSIVITPALNGRSSRPGGRAASSLYSRATFAPSFVDHRDTPPMPTNMQFFLEKSQSALDANRKDGSRDSVGTAFEEEDDIDVKRHERVTSTATVFEEEEDQTPLTAPSHGGKNAKELYIDTTILPTPRRSRGWWNVITTPFENAKSVSRFLRSPTDGSQTPDVPPLPSNMFPSKQQGKEDTLSPESARNGWPSQPPSYSQNQQQSQNQTVVVKLDTGRRAVVVGGAGSFPQDPEKLTPNARATHNSQALRRLESNERLTTEPVPPLPLPSHKAARESSHDIISPNDREVPIVLTFNPTFIVNQPPNTYQAHQNGVPQAAGLGMTANYYPTVGAQPNELPIQQSQSEAPKALGLGATMNSQKKTVVEQEQSPRSGLTEFSPVGQVSGTGTVLSSKIVIKDGNEGLSNMQTKGFHTHSMSSGSRSSLTAEIVKHPSPAMPYRPNDWRSPYYNSPQSTYPKEVPQPAQSVAFQPPPRFPSEPPATERANKIKRKPMMFEICVRKPKKPKDLKDPLKPKKKKSKKRWWCCCFCFILLLLVGLGIALAIILSRKHKAASQTQTQTQTQSSTATFVTVTNFPPVPTGQLTIARPNLRTSVSGCVNPGTMWSCAVPKEQQDAIKPNSPDQPNFVVKIDYDNSSLPSTQRLRAREPTSGTLHAMSWARRALLSARDASATPLLTPSPAAPTIEDQAFLGKTTDNITAPFEGESTPFFISFTPPAPGSSSSKAKVKRQNSGNAATSTVNVIPNLSTAIPIPEVQPDGTAEPANLLPFPVFQPLRLYNRGSPDEHYGFYTYFERNIFMKSVSIQNASQQLMGDATADENGGSTFVGANARCSWRDTRFKVQIWTNKGKTAQLLPSPSGSAPAKPTSTAQDFVQPGTFPYPVTITLDRHGGGLTTKMLFCYGMDDRGHIDIHEGRFQPETRNFSGILVNPALGPFTNVNVTAAQGGPGGIDGGTGGCLCEWSNFLAK
jgi:hypothetical protein